MPSSFSPGTVVSARDRLWRVDQQDGSVLTATPIDGGGDEQRRFFLPMEDVSRGELDWPSRETIDISGQVKGPAPLVAILQTDGGVSSCRCRGSHRTHFISQST